LLKKTLYAVSSALPANGLQAWEAPDASELSSIGKINVFRENRAKATEN
jgi:hypothetical protein